MSIRIAKDYRNREQNSLKHFYLMNSETPKVKQYKNILCIFRYIELFGLALRENLFLFGFNIVFIFKFSLFWILF
jgi:hypothetical protein